VALRLADLLLGVSAVPLMSIGDNALFIGPRNMTVNSKNLPCVQGNSITILTTSGSDGQLLQYDLAKGTRSVVCDGNFLKFSWPIPRPYSLVHHIVTCCHRLFWSSGHIWCDNETEVYMQWGARARARVSIICTDRLELVLCFYFFLMLCLKESLLCRSQSPYIFICFKCMMEEISDCAHPRVYHYSVSTLVMIFQSLALERTQKNASLLCSVVNW
jgi:hypothetical protein